jgi:hypothetical protein
MVEGVSCRFFDEQTVESLQAALADFDPAAFSAEDCRENALRFSIDRFKQQLGDYVEMRWQEHVSASSG